jgi:glycerophosphoryl diester phosphodiesterase
MNQKSFSSSRESVRFHAGIKFVALALVALPLVSTVQAAPKDGSTTAPKKLMTSKWNVRDHMASEKIIVQSHRGAGDLAPENTLTAFELGWKLGTYPECDVRQTTDGVICTFHDNNFARVVKDCPPELKTKGVEDVTWEQLQKLNVGAERGSAWSGRKVTRLTDAFAIMEKNPDHHLYLDIKKVDLDKLAKQVKDNHVEKQIVFTSQYQPLLIDFRKKVPECDTLNWIGETLKDIKAKVAAAEKTDFKDITQLQIHVRVKKGMKAEDVKRNSVNPFNVPDKYLIDTGNLLRKHHILYQVLPYGGTTKEIYWKLLDLGVMSFATDHPDLTMPAIKEYYTLPAASTLSKPATGKVQ